MTVAAACAMAPVSLLAGLRRAAAVGALALISCGSSHAQAPVAAPSAALACMTPADTARPKPEYPEAALRLKRSGDVSVELRFAAADEAPAVVFEGERGDRMFEPAVAAYAAQLRIPCMKPGDKPVKVRQSFQFVPNDGRKVVWTTAVDEADAERRRLNACMVAPGYDDRPAYPQRQLERGLSGTVVLRGHFVAADKAPEVEVLDNGGSDAFAASVRGFLEKARVPCLGETPLDTILVYSFRMAGQPQPTLQDVDLATWIRVARPAPSSVFFDMTTMKCPFDVRLTLRQPVLPNVAEELEDDVPARHAFLDWLAHLQAGLEATKAKALYGQQMTIHVPCGMVDL